MRRLARVVGVLALVILAGLGGYRLGYSVDRPPHDQLAQCQKELRATQNLLEQTSSGPGATLVITSASSDCLGY
jgi:hypothetical protein